MSHSTAHQVTSVPRVQGSQLTARVIGRRKSCFSRGSNEERLITEKTKSHWKVRWPTRRRDDVSWRRNIRADREGKGREVRGVCLSESAAG